MCSPADAGHQDTVVTYPPTHDKPVVPDAKIWRQTFTCGVDKETLDLQNPTSVMSCGQRLHACQCRDDHLC